jgi:hypothetical protein
LAGLDDEVVHAGLFGAQVLARKARHCLNRGIQVAPQFTGTLGDRPQERPVRSVELVFGLRELRGEVMPSRRAFRARKGDRGRGVRDEASE